MDKKRIKVLMPFLRKVEKEFHPQKVILFGSRARGDHSKESDYDLLIIADDFHNIHVHDRMTAAYQLKRNIAVAMDLICLTPEEFTTRKKKIGVIQAAAKEGKVLYSAN